MITYNIVAASSEATVVAEYTPESYRATDYQSEAALERILSAVFVGRAMSTLALRMKRL